MDGGSPLGMNGALRGQLEPLSAILTRPDVFEVVVNKPGEVWVESAAGWQVLALPELTYTALERIAVTTANASGQFVDATKPLLSATLPGGERIQIVIPPATSTGVISVTIRKASNKTMTLGQLEQGGLFSDLKAVVSRDMPADDLALTDLLRVDNIPAFLLQCIEKRKNIIIAGATGSGKTTLSKALIGLVPEHERIITIEDTPELVVPHKNYVRLLYSKGGQNGAKIGAKELLEASLRMRPDRIIMGEIRDGVAFDFLRNVNSGHPGSITTVHANSCELAFEQLTLLVKESETGRDLERADIRQLLETLIDVVVQCKRVGGKFRVTEIWFGPDQERRRTGV
jgi:type IV secretion system protein VirB11